ncbi:MAG: sterol desaturase family protein [Phycisphaeraceae bacterium]|nr:sterol desaturase family protein [Phycisphaeraceae bacterium]
MNGEQNPEQEYRKAHFSLETTEPTSFGHGWISGLISAILGIVGFGAVICFHYPTFLTMPELQRYYLDFLPYIRALLHVILVVSFLLGVISICLRHNKALGLIGLSSVLLAALLGGSHVPLDGEVSTGPLFGLDWFLLNLIVYSVVYIPLECLFAKHPEQPTFRKEWRVDVTYFFLNTLLIQITSLLTMSPAMIFFDWARVPSIVGTVSKLPLLIQIPLCLLVADFTQYWIHRAFHSVPFLWRFHAIHHSTEAMDWLAGARLHLVDVIITRGLTYVPIYVLGFSEAALVAYVMVVVIQATFIHANVRWEFPGVRWLLATPCFHHWHHAAEPQAVDKNFSVHTPFWDRLFGTFYMPGRWPEKYGLCGKRDVPSSWLLQFFYPFRRPRIEDFEE